VYTWATIFKVGLVVFDVISLLKFCVPIITKNEIIFTVHAVKNPSI